MRPFTKGPKLRACCKALSRSSEVPVDLSRKPSSLGARKVEVQKKNYQVLLLGLKARHPGPSKTPQECSSRGECCRIREMCFNSSRLI